MHLHDLRVLDLLYKILTHLANGISNISLHMLWSICESFKITSLEKM